jgi:hypothetical protein
LESHFFDRKVPQIVTPAQMERVTNLHGDTAEIPVEKLSGGYGSDGGTDAERTREC